MAIFHCTTKPIARSAGRSSVAAAAYRSGSELVDQRTGMIHNYTRRAGVESAEILMPDGGTADRAELWNAAEAAEKRKDSRTAREWIVALPAELGEAGRKQLAHDFARELADRYGVAVDVAIHHPDQEGDKRNHHAHLLTTTRQVSRGKNGIELGKKTALELGDKDRAKAGIEGRSAHDIEQLRECWAELTNLALEREGRGERIDHRSLAAQGIDREATTHLGPVATDMERRGKASDRGEGNRQVAANNAGRERLTAQVIDLAAERDRRRPVEQEQSPAEIRQEIEHYKRQQGPLPFMRIADVADKSDAVIHARRQLDALERRRTSTETSRTQAENEMLQWKDRHPVRARLAALGLSNPVYLSERQQVIESANEWLKTAGSQINQAKQIYTQTRAEGISNVEAKYRPQRDWVADAERRAAERDRVERLQASRDLQRTAEEQDQSRDDHVYRGR
ncbi:MobQ family relaxase [Pseudomonas saponiphila]